MFRKSVLIAVVLTLIPVCLAEAQTPQSPQTRQRDLRYETEAADAGREDAVTIPRSYALVIAIANYKNLRDEQQLQFSERDANAIYSVLISPEGGNFPAQNVQKLVGANATLTNIREKLEQWLPGAARADDRVLIYFAGHGFVA